MANARLVLIDDHPLILQALQQLFGTEAEFVVAGTASRYEEGVRMIEDLGPDAVILDLRLPDKGGLDLLERISGRLPVVILTGGLDDDELRRALILGAKGVILKERAPDLLVECVTKVLAGERWIDPDLVPRALGIMDRTVRSERAKTLLSPREIEITTLVARGLRNREIAESLFISEATVKSHLGAVFEKTGVESRVALANWARHQGLID